MEQLCSNGGVFSAYHMAISYPSFLHKCVAWMLQPIAGFCVSRGVKFQDFVELSRQSFVQAATTQLNRGAKEQSVSRISVMTGIQRPDVKRLIEARFKEDPKDITYRILGQWSSDRRFLDSKHRPRPLEIRGEGSEFSKLIRLVNTDLNPHTVRFELERLGLIRTEGRTAHLLQAEFIATGATEQTLRFGTEDMADLLKAVEENAFLGSEVPNLHARTQYDNIPDEHVPKLKQSLLALGRRFHADCRKLLAPFDKDINPKRRTEEGRTRIVVGTFSRAEDILEVGPKEPKR